jgi:predicted porin
MYASLKIDTTPNATANTHVGTNAGVVDSTYTHSLLAATYTMGAFKIHAGTGGSKASADANVKTKGTVYGVTYTMGQWDLMANMAKVDDQGTQNVDRKMTGLGVNYNFSKTVRGYLRYDSLNWASNIAAAAGSEQKRTAAGFSVTF